MKTCRDVTAVTFYRWDVENVWRPLELSPLPRGEGKR
jgi:hypothetical protein